MVRRLAAGSDALIEGYRPGVAERLGVGPADCWALNPALVYGRMTGWGQDGPLAAAAGHDIAYIAVTGALHAVGRAGGPPQVPVNYLGDFGGGSMFLALGVVAALLSARASGRGQVVDAAIVDGAAVLQAMTYGLLADGSWTDQRGSTGSTPARRSTTCTRRRRAAHGGRRARAAVLRGVHPAAVRARGGAGRSPRPARPAAVGGDAVAVRRAVPRALPGRMVKGIRRNGRVRCPDPEHDRGPVRPAPGRAGHVHDRGRRTAARPAPRFSAGVGGGAIGALPAGAIAPVGAHTRAALTDLGFADVEELLSAGAVWQA